MDLGFLQELGLTKNESKIYSSLLNLGSASAGRITFETNLHRSRVYEGLNRLSEKGMVSSVIKGSVTFFEATDPEKIIDYLDEEQARLEGKKKAVEKMLPRLREMGKSKPTAEAQILQGIEGFKAMRRDVLRHAKGEHLLIGAIAREDTVMPLFFEKWNRERIRKGIKVRILHKVVAKGKPMTRMRMSQTRYLPPDIVNPAVINIYGDRVVNVIWKGDYPLCFLMVNSDIAQAYRNYFELLWKASAKGAKLKK